MRMNLIKNYKMLIILIVTMILIAIPKIVYGAGSFSISSTSKSMTKGGTTTITVTAKNCAGQFSISSSNSSVVSVSSSSAWLDSSSTIITLTAKGEGTANITIKAVDVTDTDLNDITGTKTCKVTVKAKSSGSSSSGSSSSSSGTSTSKPVEKPKSTDSTLSALSIKEGAITPEFKKDVKEYALTVPYEVSEVNVTATANDSKAKVAIDGNKDLKEGENTVKVLVTAENGTSTTYTIKVTRKRVPIALKSLIVKYQNETGEMIETPLSPAFNFDTLEYTLQDLEYWVKSLNVEAIPNIEGATVDIKGADTLQIGENTITITLKILEENTPKGEEPKEETITYTIKVNLLEEPTILAKIQNWFKGLMGTVGTWFNNNQTKIILGSLAACIVALIGLSVYIIVDYNKYKDVIAKVKKVNEINSTETISEEISKKEDIDKNEKPKGGKHF